MNRQGEKNCDSCRFWSEMCAQSFGCGPIEALCLSADGPSKGKFVRANHTCDRWKSGHLGAVDSPPNYGEHIRAAYEAEEARP